MNEELSQEVKPANRDETGKFKPGFSGNPSGRPKGTLKDYVRRYFMEMSDEDKAEWLVRNKINPIDIWKMGEGNPKQDTEIDATISGPGILRLDE